ncbi:MAG: hypothetical protein Q9190_003800 [Brigantiaea leucoxantha]
MPVPAAEDEMDPVAKSGLDEEPVPSGGWEDGPVPPKDRDDDPVPIIEKPKGGDSMLEEPEPKAVPDDDVETPLAADVVPDEDNVLLVSLSMVTPGAVGDIAVLSMTTFVGLTVNVSDPITIVSTGDGPPGAWGNRL